MSEIVVMAGLLGPNGEWHPCGFAEHHAESERIVREKHREEHAAWYAKLRPELAAKGYVSMEWEFLHERGWLHISDEGYVDPLIGRRGEMQPTQAQLDVLWDLYAEAKRRTSYRMHGLEEFWKSDEKVEAMA